MNEIVRLLKNEFVKFLPRILRHVSETKCMLQLFRNRREWIGTGGIINRIRAVPHHSQDSPGLTLQVHLKPDKVSDLIRVPRYRNDGDEIDERLAVLLVINKRYLALLKIVDRLSDMRNTFVVGETASFTFPDTTGRGLEEAL
jgi:hypothetical protein